MHPEFRNGAVAERSGTTAPIDEWAFPLVAPPRRRRGLRGRVWLASVLGVLALVAVGAYFYLAEQSNQSPPAAPAEVIRPAARGEVVPVARARVGTISGGQISQIRVAAGDHVDAQQAIARVSGPDGLEVVLAPWAGTVTGVLAHEGDTVVAGSILVTLGDLSRLQVETSDVDEFLVGRIARGTPVRLTVDAIDGSQMHGVVRTVGVEPQTTASGDRVYPATIDLVDPPATLRPGMTVRMYLGG